MNWGYRIAIAFVLFASFIGYIVYKASTTKIDLVDSNYYEQELKYQNVMNEKQNTAELNWKPVIKQSNSSIIISFPADSSNMVEKCKCVFFRPSDSRLDRTIDVSLTNGEYQLAANQFVKGCYTIKLRWQMNGKNYMDEQNIFVQ